VEHEAPGSDDLALQLRNIFSDRFGARGKISSPS
jgi:hypothetical protein